MEDKLNEQLQDALEAASESIAAGGAADSDPAPEGAAPQDGQPSPRKWANLFDSPEKLEQAYGHIYRAFHAKSRELQETRQALDNLMAALNSNSPPFLRPWPRRNRPRNKPATWASSS